MATDKIDAEMHEALADANDKLGKSISRATLYRWWNAADNQKSLEPKKREKRAPVRELTNNQSEAFFYLASLWDVCRKKHAGSIDWIVGEKSMVIDELDITINQKRFLWRVTAGEVIREYALRKGISKSDACKKVATQLLQYGVDHPFPLADLNSHNRGFDIVGKRMLPGGIDFISQKSAIKLFAAVEYWFEDISIERISKYLLEWVDEASVPDIRISMHKIDLLDTNYLASIARLHNETRLPFSKKKIRALKSKNYNFAHHLDCLKSQS